jgi:hypothetical protein
MNTNQTSQPAAARLSWPARLLLGVGATVVLTLLAIAACLRPAERGYGTHQQLGLPPCTSVALFGRRCPSCGMTTSWAYMLHGHPWLACRANAGGAMLAVLGLLGGPWSLACAARGRWLLARPRDGVLVCLALLVVGVTLVDWGWRLALGAGPVTPAAVDRSVEQTETSADR